MAEQSKLRFAVGVFDDWQQLREALHDVNVRGLLPASINCLALERTFTSRTLMASSREITMQALPFPGNLEPITCTSGVLADCLTERLIAGALSLKDALGHWLIPRHAAHLEDAILAGKILFWIRVGDADDERHAYHSLLAHSSNSVGVHDLVRLGE